MISKLSGDWWIYGEDHNNYYYCISDKTEAYIYVSGKRAVKYPLFNKHDYRTWPPDKETIEYLNGLFIKK
jgi:hypothetical protein